MDKFVLQMCAGGYCEVYWRGIFLGRGRPWVKAPDHCDYNELVNAVFGDKDCHIAKPLNLPDGCIG